MTISRYPHETMADLLLSPVTLTNHEREFIPTILLPAGKVALIEYRKAAAVAVNNYFDSLRNWGIIGGQTIDFLYKSVFELRAVQRLITSDEEQEESHKELIKSLVSKLLREYIDSKE